MGQGLSFSCSAWERLALKGLSSSSALPAFFCLHGYRAIWISLEIATSRLQNITRRTQTDPWGTLLVISVQPDLLSLTSTV